MNMYITYFYHVRNLLSHQVPLSTATWDPKWYHANQGDSHVFIDKRGIVNGLHIYPLRPPKECSNLCRGREGCEKNPKSCDFLRLYKKHLDSLDFDEFMYQLETHLQQVASWAGITHEIEPVILVYEKPDNPCSERWPLIDWFSEHGITLQEYGGT